MSVPMQLVKQLSKPPKQEGLAQLSDLLSPEFTSTEQWDTTLDYIFRLQDEIRALREELAQARRDVKLKDTLLKNYLRREQILRAELVDKRY